MVPKKCHANAGWYAENDPTGNSRMVTGWWQQDDKYLHHSVVATIPRFSQTECKILNCKMLISDFKERQKIFPAFAT